MVTTSWNKVRLIAFYLPQFYPIPENDHWWGKGFTEWTNLVKAKPLFRNHYQPHLPADLGFYDLRLVETQKAQADLAKEYGIHGFCYYHYWFSGKLLLERPLHAVIDSGEPNFPFCLCWANEDWTRAWDGETTDILIKQTYDAEDDRNHIHYLLKIFDDRRYIRINGKPLFLVYRANKLSNPPKTIEIWRQEAMERGLPGLYLCRVESSNDEHTDPEKIGFDASVEFQPDWTELGPKLRGRKYKDHSVYRYEDVVNRMLKKVKPAYKRFPGVTPSWDNSPRRKKGAVIFIESTPELYEKWLKETIKKVNTDNEKENFVFINAWNEWAEGNHLEPDQKFGRGFLEATRRALMLTMNEAGPSPEGKGVRGNKFLTNKPEYEDVAEEKPIVSIVILTKNGGKLFQKSIEMIFSQKIDIPFEVIVVDSGSMDDTLNILKRYPMYLFRIKPWDFSFGKTRDYGFEKTQGQYIVTLSQDVIPANEYWLEKLVQPLMEDKGDVVQGETVVPVDQDIFYWERKGLFYFTTEREEFSKRYSEIGLSCCNLAMKREAWLNTRFGNAAMNEDKVIQKKLIEKGFRIIRAPGAIAYHGHTYTLKSLKKRCENEGLGWRCACVTYRFSQMIKDLLPKIWVYKMLVIGLLSREIKTPAEALFLLIRPIYLFKGNRFNKVYKNEYASKFNG